MVYFLINNNYHLIDLEKHRPHLKSLDLAIICVRHTVETCYLESFALPTISLKPILLSKPRSLLPWTIVGTRRSIVKAFPVGPTDTLVMYTEHELVNQIVANRFYRCGARVMLLEEGLATYVEHCFTHHDRVGAIKKAVYYYLLFVCGLHRSRLSGSATLSPTFMDDRTFFRVLLYMNVPLKRQIEAIVVAKDYEKIEGLDAHSIIILNEDNYNFYETMDEYLAGMRTLLTITSAKFEQVHFKFHPREYRENPLVLETIRQMLSEFPKVKEVESREPVESLASKLGSKYVMSYMSIGLINLCYYGLEPLFVHTLFPHLACQPDFMKITGILDMLNYRFIESLDQVNPGYVSGLVTDFRTVPLAQVLKV